MGVIDKAKELLGFSDPTITVNMEGAKKPEPIDQEDDTENVEEKIFGNTDGHGLPPTLNIATKLNSEETDETQEAINTTDISDIEAVDNN